jgi:hypothetical protein
MSDLLYICRDCQASAYVRLIRRMVKKTDAEGAEPLTAKNGGVLVGRDWQGQPIYAASADKPTATVAPNVSDKEAGKS